LAPASYFCVSHPSCCSKLLHSPFNTRQQSLHTATRSNRCSSS
jgi:hypothetical protein